MEEINNLTFENEIKNLEVLNSNNCFIFNSIYKAFKNVM